MRQSVKGVQIMLNVQEEQILKLIQDFGDFLKIMKIYISVSTNLLACNLEILMVIEEEKIVNVSMGTKEYYALIVQVMTIKLINTMLLMEMESVMSVDPYYKKPSN